VNGMLCKAHRSTKGFLALGKRKAGQWTGKAVRRLVEWWSDECVVPVSAVRDANSSFDVSAAFTHFASALDYSTAQQNAAHYSTA
jgi:hypothetical protein